MRFLHTAQVLRERHAVASGAETYNGFAQVFPALRCLIEPMPAWRQATAIGIVGGRVFCVTWANEALREGDRVVWQGRTFKLALNSDDRYRGQSAIPAYQTGTLTEDVVSRG